MNYDLVVEVKQKNQDCKVAHLEVYDRFGTKSLTSGEVLKTKCATPPKKSN